MKNWIKNFEDLATTEDRKIALQIVEAGLSAIDTEEIISKSLQLDGDNLTIAGEKFDLSKFKRVKVVGFGKASMQIAKALEGILGSKITSGAVVGLQTVSLDHIESFAGTHPVPSKGNLIAGEKIYKILKDGSEEDLVIVLVSGGGSALLCYPESECVDGARLYNTFLAAGKTIKEINTVRKHLSMLKGGGLAKLAYPATVVGLIFSDVPGDDFAQVASGPTYKDASTVDMARQIISENNLGNFDLIETPKDDKYFEKVHNFVLVSNTTALEAMRERAEELGLKTKTISHDLYDEINVVIRKIFSSKETDSVILAGGEPSIKVKDQKGQGGRNLHMALEVVGKRIIDSDSVFISFASDGMDNSDMAGAIVDKTTMDKVSALHLDAEDYLRRFDSYGFFKQTGDMLQTGPTDSNVSDLMLLLTKK